MAAKKRDTEVSRNEKEESRIENPEDSGAEEILREETQDSPAETAPDENTAEETQEADEAGELPVKEEDTAAQEPEEEDLVFIDETSVRERSRMAGEPGEQHRDVKEKKTRRRAADSMEIQKEKSFAYLRRNIAFIGIAALVIIVALAAVAVVVKKNRAEDADTIPAISDSAAYEVSASDEITNLLIEYYTAYASDSMDDMLYAARPFTDYEKEYIEIVSSYIESFENVVCYSKEAAEDGTYLVAAYCEVKYADVDTTAPQLSFYYVETNEAGDLYINNVYSPYNITYGDTDTDPEITALLSVYQAEEDIAGLILQVEENYNEALAADEALSEMVSTTIPEALADWEQTRAEELAAEEEALEAEEEEAVSQEDETAEDTENAEDTESTEDTETASDDSETSSEEEEEVTETEKRAWVYVTDDVLIRAEPSTDSEALASALSGTKIRQIAVTSNGWTKVLSGDITGYIKTDYISKSKP